MTTKPSIKPKRPFFSSGPCVKYPGWTLNDLGSALVSRSHRSQAGLSRIQEVLTKTRTILGIPDDYLVAITPGSATGAMEMALWNLIGERGVELLSWDVFGRLWVQCLQDRLNLKNLQISDTAAGYLPNLNQVDFENDVIFTWNGSTTGVRVPDGNWIPEDRQGLAICDATSAAFAYDLPWNKLDVTVFSWQKALGGEAAHGMLVLSPRAYERLQKYTPAWPIPLLFRLKVEKERNMRFFEGYTLNTPSLLCIEDYIKALDWADGIGGLKALIRKSEENADVIEKWVSLRTGWIKNLAQVPETQSTTTVCLVIEDDRFRYSNADIQWGIVEEVVKLLETEEAAFDIKNHRYSQPGFRFWCGPTVETSDLEKALPWIEWGYQEVLSRS